MVVALRERVPGQERREVRLRRDRADAGAAAAVRDAERLVQVEVRDVAAEVAEAREAEQGVEVGAVDVDLSAGVVHGLR